MNTQQLRWVQIVTVTSICDPGTSMAVEGCETVPGLLSYVLGIDLGTGQFIQGYVVQVCTINQTSSSSSSSSSLIIQIDTSSSSTSSSSSSHRARGTSSSSSSTAAKSSLSSSSTLAKSSHSSSTSSHSTRTSRSSHSSSSSSSDNHPSYSSSHSSRSSNSSSSTSNSSSSKSSASSLSPLDSSFSTRSSLSSASSLSSSSSSHSSQSNSSAENYKPMPINYFKPSPIFIQSTDNQSTPYTIVVTPNAPYIAGWSYVLTIANQDQGIYLGGDTTGTFFDNTAGHFIFDLFADYRWFHENDPDQKNVIVAVHRSIPMRPDLSSEDSDFTSDTILLTIPVFIQPLADIYRYNAISSSSSQSRSSSSSNTLSSSSSSLKISRTSVSSSSSETVSSASSASSRTTSTSSFSSESSPTDTMSSLSSASSFSHQSSRSSQSSAPQSSQSSQSELDSSSSSSLHKGSSSSSSDQGDLPFNQNAVTTDGCIYSSIAPQISETNPEISSITYFVGAFTEVTGTNGTYSRLGAAAVDIKTGAVTSWDPNLKKGTSAGIGYTITADSSQLGQVIEAFTPPIFYIGGDFTFCGDIPRLNLAAFDLNGNLQDWDMQPNDVVRSIAVDQAIVAVGGDFTSVGDPIDGTHTVDFFIAFNGLFQPSSPFYSTSGTYNSAISFGVVDAPIHAVSIGFNHLVIGGFFTIAGGQTRLRAAALRLISGYPLADWSPPIGGNVNTICYGGLADVPGSSPPVTAESFILGGNFSIGISPSTTLENLAYYFLYNPGESSSSSQATDGFLAGGNTTGFNYATNNQVYQIVIDRLFGVPYIVGDFTQFSYTDVNTSITTVIPAISAGITNNIGIASNAWPGKPLPSGFDARTVAQPSQPDYTFIGGCDPTVGNIRWRKAYGEHINESSSTSSLSSHSSISSNTPSSSSSSSSTPSSLSSHTQSSSTSSSSSQGSSQSTQSSSSNNSGLPYRPSAIQVAEVTTAGNIMGMVVVGDTLYLAGGFKQLIGINGTFVRHRVGAINLLTGAVLPWNPVVSYISDDPKEPYVASLASDGTNIYMAGLFTTIGGAIDSSSSSISSNESVRVTRNNFAAVDAITGIATNWNPFTDSTVGNAVRYLSGTGNVYIMGDFTEVYGQPRYYIAELHTDGTLTSYNLDPNRIVTDITYEPTYNALYVVGAFTKIHNHSTPIVRGCGCATSTDGITIFSWDPQADGVNSQINSVAILEQTVAIGGYFSSIQRQPHIRAAIIPIVNSTNPNPPVDNTSYGTIDTDLGGEVGICLSVVDAPNSDIYFAGAFQQVNGIDHAMGFTLNAADDHTAWPLKHYQYSGTSAPQALVYYSRFGGYIIMGTFNDHSPIFKPSIQLDIGSSSSSSNSSVSSTTPSSLSSLSSPSSLSSRTPSSLSSVSSDSTSSSSTSLSSNTFSSSSTSSSTSSLSSYSSLSSHSSSSLSSKSSHSSNSSSTSSKSSVSTVSSSSSSNTPSSLSSASTASSSSSNESSAAARAIAPSFSPTIGYVVYGSYVTMSTPTPDSTMYYTLGFNNQPPTGPTAYTTPIQIINPSFDQSAQLTGYTTAPELNDSYTVHVNYNIVFAATANATIPTTTQVNVGSPLFLVNELSYNVNDNVSIQLEAGGTAPLTFISGGWLDLNGNPIPPPAGYLGGWPNGLVVDPSTGIIAGNLGNYSGGYLASLGVTNPYGGVSSFNILLAVAGIAPIINRAVTTFNVQTGDYYEIPFTIASGSLPLTWSAGSPGTLPAGATIDPVTGIFSGTTSPAGSYTYTIYVTNNTGGDQVLITIDVADDSNSSYKSSVSSHSSLSSLSSRSSSSDSTSHSSISSHSTHSSSSSSNTPSSSSNTPSSQSSSSSSNTASSSSSSKSSNSSGSSSSSSSNSSSSSTSSQ